MTIKLHYFHLNGLAEPIRYILHYAGEKFEDIRYPYGTAVWPDKKVKDSLPYGQFPVYEEGKIILNQSLAIARYLAAKYNLLPSDPVQQAVLDATVLNIYDFWKQVLAYIKEKDLAKRGILRKQILEESIPYFFTRFEKELEATNGHFGGKLTWADFILVGIVEAANLFLEYEIEKYYPVISALIEKITSLPGVKEYITTRKPYDVTNKF